MTNPQLIGFIKQSLQQGSTKEKIINDLVSNGWTLIDIEQGFSSLNTTSFVNLSPTVSTTSTFSNEPIFTEESHLNKKAIFLVIGIIFLLALGVSGYYFRNDLPIVKDLIKNNNTQINELNQNQTDILKLIEEQTETSTVEKTIPVENQLVKVEEITIPIVAPSIGDKIVVKTEVIDCGTTSIPITNDKQRKAKFCFDEQFKKCNFAKILEQSSDGSAVSYNEILGIEEKICLVKTLVLKSTIKDWENKEMTCKFDNSKSISDISVNNIYKCSGDLFDVMTNKTLYSDQTKTVDYSTGISLDANQFMFVSPAQNSKVKIGDIVQFKIIAGKNIKKIQFHASFSGIDEEIPLINGNAEFSLEVPVSLRPIILSLDGWTKDGDIITDVDRDLHGLDTSGIILVLEPYTNYKVIEIHEVPNVIEAQKWETSILPEPIYAEFENNTIGGLLQIYSDINFKIEDESIIKLIKFGEIYKMKGLKSGETYIDITYMGITKKVPIYVQ
ncbi:MAG: hypothetical protein JJE53_01490 [Candidatus Pacebacteria bacterium]|nr:hypothetical protein [Candidatus Paceibacterota bacterium]